jgi:hypothetical protein
VNDWLVIAIVALVFILLIGNFSTVHKNSRQKLRKTGLNDLKETLPRSNKSAHTMPTVKTKLPTKPDK